jgi:LCP family protein required for cell wall assembly
MNNEDLHELDLHRLDDPAGFVPDRQFRDGARAKGRARSRRRTMGIGAIGVATLLLALVVGYGGFQKWRASQVVRLDLAANLDPPESESPPDPGLDPPPAPSQAQNILIVGSDQAMPGEGREQVTAVNTDTMMVVRADPGTGTIAVLSLPRDLWVDIPDQGQGRINTAWEAGGPALLIETIKANFDIPVNHFLQVDGGGFQRLVDQAGGSDVWVAGELRDAATGFAAAGPGCVHLDGPQALALVRSRHLEFNDPARGWIEDPASDLGRIQRQQLMGRVLASSLLDQDLGVGAADQLLDTLIDNAAIDNTWAIRDMAGLLFWAQGLDLDTSLTTATPPVRSGWAGQAAVLYLDEATAGPVLSLFRPSVAPAEPDPASGATGDGTTAITAPATTTTVATAPTGIAAEWVQAGPPEGGRC